MKTLLLNNKKIALIHMNNEDYFNYWANKADKIYHSNKLSFYEKTKELERCVASMKFWRG
jgi:hypothetical protein